MKKLYMKHFSLVMLWLLLFSAASVEAQVGINNPNPDSSSILDLKHDSRGLLIPRMDELSRRSIVKPARGLTVYDTYYEMFFYFRPSDKINRLNGWYGLSPWRFMDTLVDPERHVVLDARAANVGIGTSDPENKLSVLGNVSVGSNSSAPADGMLVQGNVQMNSSLSVQDTVQTDIVSAGTLYGYGTIPVGGIIMWSGDPAALPDGWLLCDGSLISDAQSPKNGETLPDLSGRFIVGVGQATGAGAGPTNYTINTAGGEETHTLTVNEMPSHNHGGTTSTNGAHSHTYTRPNGGEGYVAAYNSSDEVYKWNNTGDYSTSSAGNHSHTISAQGGGLAHENRPPYFVLAYIMRTR